MSAAISPLRTTAPARELRPGHPVPASKVPQAWKDDFLVLGDVTYRHKDHPAEPLELPMVASYRFTGIGDESGDMKLGDEVMFRHGGNSLEEAVGVAKKQANHPGNDKGFAQAHAVVQAQDGAFMVTPLGFVNAIATGMPHQLDGEIWGEPSGNITTQVRPGHPALRAVVGGQGLLWPQTAQ